MTDPTDVAALDFGALDAEIERLYPPPASLCPNDGCACRYCTVRAYQAAARAEMRRLTQERDEANAREREQRRER